MGSQFVAVRGGYNLRRMGFGLSGIWDYTISLYENSLHEDHCGD